MQIAMMLGLLELCFVCCGRAVIMPRSYCDRMAIVPWSYLNCRVCHVVFMCAALCAMFGVPRNADFAIFAIWGHAASCFRLWIKSKNLEIEPFCKKHYR